MTHILWSLALRQDARAGDTLLADSARAHAAPLDSVTLEHPPLPGGVAAFVRFLFHVPQWIQIGGAILALIVAVVIAVLLWRRRAAIRGWLVTRSRGATIALAATALLIVGAVAAFGAVSWNYMMHDNDFCSGCHVMAPAFGRFATSEHAKLSCHDCHRQSIFASSRQLYFWVLDRPERIPPHAKVPTNVCAECHIQDRPDSVWQRISATAGHRVHLESDSSALKDVQCVTCHGVEVHAFAPADSTCGQSECHAKTEIRLAGMRDQTTLHCTACHEFTRPITEQVSTDSAQRALVPRERECLACHEMRQRLADFDARTEPHEAACGACHNPHEQETPQAAFETCATAGCHARADTISRFHRGVRPGVLADCGECHEAHQWQVSGQTCLTCHADIFDEPRPGRARGSTRTAHAPDTSITFRHAVFEQAPPAGPPQAAASQPPFSHRRHREVECTACHRTGEPHGEVTVRTERDCQSCHHAPARAASSAQCAACHQTAELRRGASVPTELRLSVWREPRTRPLPFQHRWHTGVECTACHTEPLTFAAERNCASCHAEHHTVEQSCRACHESGKATHEREAHLGCAGSGCHSAAGTVALEAVRNVCLTCHQDMVTHRPGRECAQCHQVRWLAEARGGGARR